jgi:hypothetical protein
MGRVQDYRRFAEECLKLAQASDDPQTRASFLQMAQVWFRLAEQARDDEPDDSSR